MPDTADEVVWLEWLWPNGVKVAAILSCEDCPPGDDDAIVPVSVWLIDPSTEDEHTDPPPVVDSVPSTEAITHPKLRREVEWAIGLVVAAAAERAKPPQPSDGERAAELLDRL